MKQYVLSVPTIDLCPERLPNNEPSLAIGLAGCFVSSGLNHFEPPPPTLMPSNSTRGSKNSVSSEDSSSLDESDSVTEVTVGALEAPPRRKDSTSTRFSKGPDMYSFHPVVAFQVK